MAEDDAERAVLHLAYVRNIYIHALDVLLVRRIPTIVNKSHCYGDHGILNIMSSVYVLMKQNCNWQCNTIIIVTDLQ